MDAKFFKSEKEFRQWLMKNHDKKKELWVGLYKGIKSKDGLTQRQAADQALCFGWSFGIIKGIDPFTYKIRFVPRRASSGWSALNIKRFNELKKLGVVHKSGLRSFQNRDDSKSLLQEPKFSAKQLKAFKANSSAWGFFLSQTNSYRRYTTWWVISAKRSETQDKRLQMLIADSGKGQKLQRILDAVAKVEKKNHDPGKTPIEKARNIGPVVGGELRSLGIDTVEKMKACGWEKVLQRVCELYPHRMNLNMAMAIAASCEDQDARKLDPDLKAEAKAFLSDLKRGLR